MKKIKSINLKLAFIALASISLCSCDFLDGFLDDSNTNTNTDVKENIYDYLTSITCVCDEWTHFDSYFYDYFIGRTNSQSYDYAALKLASKAPFTNVKYKSVDVTLSCERTAKHGIHNYGSHHFSWPTNEDGTLKYSANFSCDCRKYDYVIKGTTYSASGIVKYNLSCYKDGEGFIYDNVGLSDSSTISRDWNFVGINFSPVNKTVRFPSNIRDHIIDRFGLGSFDLIGFDNVENIIIPSTYKYGYWDKGWKSVQNVKNIFLESNSNNLWIVNGSIGYNGYMPTPEGYVPPKIYLYSETEPKNNPENYWHYLNYEPTLWS